MPDLPPSELLQILEPEYRSRFKDPEFGHALAVGVAARHGYSGPIIRKTEGSSLVFELGADRFLKITPPFFANSIETELAVSHALAGRLPFRIPEILDEGQVGTWKYLLTERVPGVQAKAVFKTLDAENRILFAQDIGKLIQAIDCVPAEASANAMIAWGRFLPERLQDQREIHRRKGTPEEWVDKICEFIDSQAPALRCLPAKWVHADINHEHLMLEETGGKWRVSGLIDFADAMEAPIELEFVLPILCFFKGRADLQQALFDASGCTRRFHGKAHSCLLMALALQNRFMAFHDWFREELTAGPGTIEEIAERVFSPL